MIKIGVISVSGRFDSWIRNTLNDSPDLVIAGFWTNLDSIVQDDLVNSVHVILAFFENIDADKHMFQVLKNCFVVFRKPVILVTEEYLYSDTENWHTSFPVIGLLTTSELFLPEGKEILRENIRIGSYVSKEILDSYVTGNDTVLTQDSIEIIPENLQKEAEVTSVSESYPVLLIGASTGGPKVILEIMKIIGPQIKSYAVVIAQHISHIFLERFLLELEVYSPVKIEIIHDRLAFLPGHIYLAPVRRQFILGSDSFFQPDPARHLYPFMPNIDVLFKSVALCYRKNVTAVILSGLGRDGTEGAKIVRQTGGLVIVQDPTSTNVSSMPDSVIAGGYQHYIFQPREIARFLKHYAVKSEL
ncbi:MAG: chemotaxis protein CheB [Bacteroidetes bacterium]|nr:chemotaxis protein CheB [Bacteroidota bacterium]